MPPELRRLMTRRLSRAQRVALAPADPSAAILAYSKVMASYAERVERLVERRVLSQLPVLGSGDPLDIGALQRGLAELSADLGAAAESMRRNARAAGRRASQSAKREAERLLGVKVPKDFTDDLLLDEFEARNVRLLRKLGQRQVREIQKAVDAYRDGDSMRADILHKLWVSRNNGQLIARDQPHKFQREAIWRWSRAAGSPGGIVVTRRDELVRPTHAEHDGKYYDLDQKPGIFNEPGCRCGWIPMVEAP